MKFISPASYSFLKERRLGESSYFAKLPETMFIDETKGKEGQVGYGLWQIDSIKRFTSSSGFIETEHGRPIGGESDSEEIIEYAGSNLLSGTVVGLQQNINYPEVFK